MDWPGSTMSYVDVDTGEIITAYLFAAALPYSQYGYVEAATDMKEKVWLECHVHRAGLPGRGTCAVGANERTL